MPALPARLNGARPRMLRGGAQALYTGRCLLGRSGLQQLRGEQATHARYERAPLERGLRYRAEGLDDRLRSGRLGHVRPPLRTAPVAVRVRASSGRNTTRLTDSAADSSGGLPVCVAPPSRFTGPPPCHVTSRWRASDAPHQLRWSGRSARIRRRFAASPGTISSFSFSTRRPYAARPRSNCRAGRAASCPRRPARH